MSIRFNKRLYKLEKILKEKQQQEIKLDFSDWTTEEIKQLLQWAESENDTIPENLQEKYEILIKK